MFRGRFGALTSSTRRTRGRSFGSFGRSIGSTAQEGQLNLLGIERLSRRFLTCSGQKFILASHVGADHFLIVEGEGERIEDFGRAELRVPLQDPLDARATAIERPKPTHRHTRAQHVRAAAEHVRVGSHVGMRH